MFKPNLPFDEVTPLCFSKQSIPRNTEAFVECMEYLCTSPHIDSSELVEPILQFLNLPKVKPELIDNAFIAISNMDLPDKFWTSLFGIIKNRFENNNPNICSMISCLSSAPITIILSEFNGITFLFPFLDHSDHNVRFAVLSTLYTFRNSIELTNILVEKVIESLKCIIPRLLAITLNWIVFLINIDYPGFAEMIKPHEYLFSEMIVFVGHLINMKHLEFILRITNPTICQRLSFIPHVSLAAATFILSSISESPDFEQVSSLFPSTILPSFIDVFNHPFSEGVKSELLISALLILKKCYQNTESRLFFLKVGDVLFQNPVVDDFRLISLFVDVSIALKEFEKLFDKDFVKLNSTIFLNKFVAISASRAVMHNISISQHLLKLLSTLNPNIGYWKVAVSSIFDYFWNIGDKSHFSTIPWKEVSNSIPNIEMRALFYCIVAKFIDKNQKQVNINEIKKLLFPDPIVSDKSGVSFRVEDHNNMISLIIRLCLFKCLKSISDPEELNGIDIMSFDPIYTQFNKQTSISKIPISPYYLCSTTEIGDLADSLSFIKSLKLSSNIGVYREYRKITPPYHVLNVEVSSVVSAKDKSVSLDIRISSDSYSPSLSVFLEVPDSFTPPIVPKWVTSEIKTSTKVSRRFRFTANKMKTPFIAIKVYQGNSELIHLKLCVPLIDMFSKISEPSILTDTIWSKLKFEKSGLDIPDGTWVSWVGCISVKNGTARAEKPEYLDMLESATNTIASIC